MMAVLRMIAANPSRMQRTKTATLTMASNTDQFRIGSAWQPVNDETWENHKAVDEVNHFNRHRTAVGDVLIATRLDDTPIVHLQVLSIEMANTRELTDADFDAMGYLSRADFDADWGVAASGKCWLMRVAHVTARADYNEVL